MLRSSSAELFQCTSAEEFQCLSDEEFQCCECTYVVSVPFPVECPTMKMGSQLGS